MLYVTTKENSLLFALTEGPPLKRKTKRTYNICDDLMD
jgi:hypothetical protein